MTDHPEVEQEEPEGVKEDPGSREPEEVLEALPRLPNGRFPPGVSGNPGGLSKDVKQIRELARAHGEDAIATLDWIMRNSEDHRARIVAACALLDRREADARAHRPRWRPALDWRRRVAPGERRMIPESLPPSPLLNVSEAAAMLRRKPSWIYKEAKAGRLPKAQGYQWGVFFLREQLEAFLRGEWKPPVATP